MKTVICTLPNASENINGIAFERGADGGVQARMSAAEAAQFEGIPGYAITDGAGAEAGGAPVKSKASPPAPGAARARADLAKADKAPQ